MNHELSPPGAQQRDSRATHGAGAQQGDSRAAHGVGAQQRDRRAAPRVCAPQQQYVAIVVGETRPNGKNISQVVAD